MTFKVVYDTNIIVSAVLKPNGIPASLVALAMNKQVRLFLSPAIFEEYTAVLNRPKFGLDSHVIDVFLRDFRRAAVIIHPTKRVTIVRDDSDNRFLECAQKARADYLVTGNKKHFPFPQFERTRIVSPAEFAQILIE